MTLFFVVAPAPRTSPVTSERARRTDRGRVRRTPLPRLLQATASGVRGLARYRPTKGTVDRRLMQHPEPLAGSEHLGSRFGVDGQRRMLGPGPGDRRIDGVTGHRIVLA